MPQEKKSAMEQFLGDIPVADQVKADDLFERPLVEETEPVVEAEPEKAAVAADDEPRKNRFHRRLEVKLQAEREANIALNERLKVLSETQRFAQDTGSVDEKLINLYGDDEKGRAAAKLTQQLLNETKAQAREEALEAVRAEREKEAQEVASSQQELDTMLEDIEDEFNVDITSDTPEAKKARTGFYATLEKISPKNDKGEVTAYADPIATWEMYQQRLQPKNNRAKELSSRSMVQSGASTETKLEANVQERFLRESGII